MFARWWFQLFLNFIPMWENDPIWRAYFSKGLVQLLWSSRFSFFLTRKLRWIFSGNRTGTLSGSVAGNRGSWEIQTLEFNGSWKRSPGIRRAPVEVGSKKPIIYRVWYISGCSKNGGFFLLEKFHHFQVPSVQHFRRVSLVTAKTPELM